MLYAILIILGFCAGYFCAALMAARRMDELLEEWADKK